MKALKLKDKRAIGMLVPAILALTLAAIVLVFGLLMMDELYDQSGGQTTQAGVSANLTMVGIGKFADYFDLVVLAVVISVIISLLLVVFNFGQPAQR